MKEINFKNGSKIIQEKESYEELKGLTTDFLYILDDEEFEKMHEEAKKNVVR